jgi:hypothetical protein
MYDSVFISYRRENSSTFAGMLYDVLCKRFPSSGVFKDKNKLHAGMDFPKQIEEAIDQSFAVLVLINKGWLELTNESGEKKLSDEEDYIRLEIRTGIIKGKYILPVLFDGGQMPRKKDLPEDIKKLCDFQAFQVDADNITKSIKQLEEQINELSLNRLEGTLVKSFVKLKKNPTGTLKNISNSYLDLIKRESNAVIGYFNKFKKKKKDK